jgi:hypothetical protein
MHRGIPCGLVLLLGGLFSHPSLACSCVSVSPRQVFEHDNVVVLVKVTGLETPTLDGPWTATLVVVKSWKGDLRPNSTLRAQTMGPRGACGFFIGVGDELIVYSDDKASPSLGLCNTVRGNQLRQFTEELDAISNENTMSKPY